MVDRSWVGGVGRLPTPLAARLAGILDTPDG